MVILLAAPMDAAWNNDMSNEILTFEAPLAFPSDDADVADVAEPGVADLSLSNE